MSKATPVLISIVIAVTLIICVSTFFPFWHIDNSSGVTKDTTKNQPEQFEVLNRKLDQLMERQGKQTDQLEQLDAELHSVYHHCTPATPEAAPSTGTETKNNDPQSINWLELNQINIEKAKQEFEEWRDTNGFPNNY